MRFGGKVWFCSTITMNELSEISILKFKVKFIVSNKSVGT